MDTIGRPSYSDEQYQSWLDELAPFLKLGNSLSYSIEKAGLAKHRTSLYEKYNLGDWFSDKVDAFMRMPGEIVNSIFTRMIITIDEKVKQEQPLTAEDYKNLRFFAEKHRTCHPFFTNRTEMDVKDSKESISRVLDQLEIEKTDYKRVALEARKTLDTMNAAVQSSSV